MSTPVAARRARGMNRGLSAAPVSFSGVALRNQAQYNLLPARLTLIWRFSVLWGPSVLQSLPFQTQ